MIVSVTMSGPMASGKTVLADKIAKLIREEGLPGTKVKIFEYTGVEGDLSVGHRSIRRTEFDV